MNAPAGANSIGIKLRIGLETKTKNGAVLFQVITTPVSRVHEHSTTKGTLLSEPGRTTVTLSVVRLVLGCPYAGLSGLTKARDEMLFTINPDGEIDGYVEEVEKGPYPRVRHVKLEKPIPTNESEQGQAEETTVNDD